MLRRTASGAGAGFASAVPAAAVVAKSAAAVVAKSAAAASVKNAAVAGAAATATFGLERRLRENRRGKQLGLLGRRLGLGDRGAGRRHAEVLGGDRAAAADKSLQEFHMASSWARRYRRPRCARRPLQKGRPCRSAAEAWAAEVAAAWTAEATAARAAKVAAGPQGPPPPRLGRFSAVFLAALVVTAAARLAFFKATMSSRFWSFTAMSSLAAASTGAFAFAGPGAFARPPGRVEVTRSFILI